MKVGDIIQCKDVKYSGDDEGLRRALKLDAKYKIRAIITDGFCCNSDPQIQASHIPIGVYLEEIKDNHVCHNGKEPAYNLSRFVKASVKVSILY